MRMSMQFGIKKVLEIRIQPSESLSHEVDQKSK